MTEPVAVLDDLNRMQSVDKRNMLRLISELPEQFETAMGIVRSSRVQPLTVEPNVVLLVTAGNSSVAGDMAVCILNDELDVPVVNDPGTRLPKYVGRDALVFVVDYTGRSDSVLSSYKEAVQRGALVICVTTGGKLLETAARNGTMVVKIPPGQPHRTAIGYLLVPLLAIVEKLGLTEGLTDKLSQAVKLMKNAREGIRFEYPASRNVAKRAAADLVDKLVVIYGASDYRRGLAERWKSQINANAKALAFEGVFPDVAASGISGWELAERQCERCAIVMLRDPQDRGEIADLMKASEQMLGQFDVVTIDLKGTTALEKMLYGLYLGDFVSYYLALLYGVNPTTTENISRLESTFTQEDEPE